MALILVGEIFKFSPAKIYAARAKIFHKIINQFLVHYKRHEPLLRQPVEGLAAFCRFN